MPNLILEAASFAASIYRNHYMPNGITPYVEHAARVAGRLATLPYATEEMVALAYLQEAISIGGVHKDLLTSKFNDSLAKKIYWLGEISRIRRNSKKNKLRFLDIFMGCTRDIKVIIIIDAMENLLNLDFTTTEDLQNKKAYIIECTEILKDCSGDTHKDEVLLKEFRDLITFKQYTPTEVLTVD